jgi:multiple sugar transport system permease protein
MTSERSLRFARAAQGKPQAVSGAGRRQRRVFPYVALLPAAILVVGLMVLPIAETVYHSFTNWDGLTSNFIGLSNYRLILDNPVVGQIFVNSLIFLISVPLILAASLLVAVLVYEKVIGWKVFRFLFFVPVVLSPVVVGVLFSTFFLPSGLADKLLSPFGLETFPWLSHPWPARAVVILALVWTSFGFGMVVLLSAMSNIDTALYDAAHIDGASWWTRLRRITIPMVSDTLQFLSVINVIYTFTSLFAFVFVITSGGPGFSTTTVDYYVYITTFENGQFGYGAALAFVLFLVVLALTIVQVKLFPNREVQGG